jgi:SSS family solute:Na+ symporter
MKILYLSSLIISLLGIIVAIAMMNVKSALDAWWKLASIFSGGALGIFLLAAFSRVTKSTNALIGTIAGLLIILWMSVSPLIWGKQTFASHYHSLLITVFATTTIFLVGFFSSVLLQKNKNNSFEKNGHKGNSIFG